MHYRNPPTTLYRNPLKPSRPAEVGTIAQPPQSEAAALTELWQPSSPNALLAMGLVVLEVAKSHASASLAWVSPKHEHDLSVIVAPPPATLPHPSAARSPSGAQSPPHECPLVHPLEVHADLQARYYHMDYHA